MLWSCARRHASHARGGMPVTDYAGHARLHARHACRGHASHVGACCLGMLLACLKHYHAHGAYDTSMIMPLDLGMPARYNFDVQGGNRMAADSLY